MRGELNFTWHNQIWSWIHQLSNEIHTKYHPVFCKQTHSWTQHFSFSPPLCLHWWKRAPCNCLFLYGMNRDVVYGIINEWMNEWMDESITITILLHQYLNNDLNTLHAMIVFLKHLSQACKDSCRANQKPFFEFSCSSPGFSRLQFIIRIYISCRPASTCTPCPLTWYLAEAPKTVLSLSRFSRGVIRVDCAGTINTTVQKVIANSIDTLQKRNYQPLGQSHYQEPPQS